MSTGHPGRHARAAMIVGAGRSGSTLLTMLLNGHPDVVTVGEMIGPPVARWPDATDYPCSCGLPLQTCPMWTELQTRLEARDVAFGPNHWDMEFAVGTNKIVRQLLTRSLFDGRLDRLRDRVTDRIPPIHDQMRQTVERIDAFVEEVLDMAGAQVFVDGSKDPVRVRHLRRLGSALDIRVIHLVRDAPAYVSSRRKNRDVPIESGVKEWLRSAANVDRLVAEVPPDTLIRVRYEDLCRAPEDTLVTLIDFLGLSPTEVPLSVSFGAAEHHIVGNKMRLSNPDSVRLDDSWRERLSPDDVAHIHQATAAQRRRFGYV